MDDVFFFTTLKWEIFDLREVWINVHINLVFEVLPININIDTAILYNCVINYWKAFCKVIDNKPFRLTVISQLYMCKAAISDL